MPEATTMTPSSLIARVAAIAVAVAGVTGLALWAHDSSAAPGQFAAPFPGAMSHSAEHVARLSEHINTAAGTTPQQKARIDALFAQAHRDFTPTHARMQDNHALALSLLTQERVDRAALETVRQDSMRTVDEASLRMTKLFGDVAEVLTPAQRKALAALAERHHSGHAGKHGGSR
jgi:protein CpxP